MIYTHVLNRGPAAVRSPADRLPRPVSRFSRGSALYGPMYLAMNARPDPMSTTRCRSYLLNLSLVTWQRAPCLRYVDSSVVRFNDKPDTGCIRGTRQTSSLGSSFARRLREAGGRLPDRATVAT